MWAAKESPWSRRVKKQDNPAEKNGSDEQSDTSNIETRTDFFGRPPLLESEDAAKYDELLARVTETVRPSDWIEKIWIQDIVDLSWGVWRLRRLKMNLHIASIPDAIAKMLVRPGKPEFITDVEGESGIVFAGRIFPAEAQELAQKWAAKDPSAVEEVKRLLAAHGQSMDTVEVRALVLALDSIERIDRSIMNMEMRRNAALREIDRRRDHKAFAKNLQSAMREVKEAELMQSQPKAITSSDMGDKEAA
jgi:hypothetical protein